MVPSPVPSSFPTLCPDPTSEDLYLVDPGPGDCLTSPCLYTGGTCRPLWLSVVDFWVPSDLCRDPNPVYVPLLGFPECPDLLNSFVCVGSQVSVETVEV